LVIVGWRRLVHGGMKVYAGAPGAARHYVEANRGRADDYYLSEGTGLARRYTAGPDRPVTELAPLTGDAYESWVAGRDPDTGVPRGRLRDDDRAVRFVEVVVNGPKSWSLAAALHPDVAAAYDAAQDRAAAQVIEWLVQHATTRIGPRGGQVQVPVERLEAVTVAHHTSRAGDPHWHLHLQINARVFGAGKWRGLHTVGVRDSLAAINGVGHAAVATDPQFRAVLAAHGYVLDRTGEILQLAEYVGPFSARAAQIGLNVDRYEREWTQANPGDQPGLQVLAGDAGRTRRHPRFVQPGQQVVTDREVAGDRGRRHEAGAQMRAPIRQQERQIIDRRGDRGRGGTASSGCATPASGLPHRSRWWHSPRLLERCAGSSTRVLPGGGAGGARTHDPGIMSPML
jgi:TrwC relaxase